MKYYYNTPMMTQNIRELSKKCSTPQVLDGAGTLLSPSLAVIDKTKVYFPI